MKSKLKTIFICLLVLFLLGSIVPMIGTAGSATRAPSVSIDSISLIGNMAPSGEYSNAAMQVQITISNGDTTVAAGAVLNLTISNATADVYYDEDVTPGIFLPGASFDVTYDWTPPEEGVYNISVSFDGTTFLMDDVSDNDTL